MIVVSDTGPLHYLFLLGRLDVLPALYGQVIVPRSIIDIELADNQTPQALRTFLLTPPQWLIIHNDPTIVPAFFGNLGLGERYAISLSLELHANLLLCDDRAARRFATASGIAVIGTLGIIEEAAFRKLIDFEQVTDDLTAKTNDHHDPQLIQLLRQQHLARLQNRPST